MNRFRALQNRTWFSHGIVPLIFYTVITVLMSGAILFHLNTHAIGAPFGDQFEAVRLIWWSKVAIGQGLHPAQQPLLLYPNGFFSAVQWATPMAHLAGVPFSLIVDPLTSYNLTFLFANILTGFAAFWFTYEVTGSYGGALLGGVVLMANANRQGHLVAGHLSVVTNYWRMFYLWALVRTIKTPSWRVAVLGGVFLGFALATHMTSAVYELAPLTVLVGGAFAYQYRRTMKAWLGYVILTAGVGAVMAIAFYAPFIRSMQQGDTAFLSEPGAAIYNTDLTSFITPSPFNPIFYKMGLLWPWAWDVLGDSIIEGSAYLGLVATGFSVVAIWKVWRKARLWLLIAIVGMIFALGPVLSVADQIVTVPVDPGWETEVQLPFAFYRMIPGFDMARTPGRMNAITFVGVGVLVAFGWAALMDRLRFLSGRQWRSLSVVGMLSVVMVAEYQVDYPFPSLDAPAPAYLQELAKGAEDGIVRPVLNVPVNDFSTNLWLLYYQTIHHQPVIAGHVIRNSPLPQAKIALLNAASLPGDDNFLPLMTAEDQAALIRASEAEVVIVHQRFAEGEAMARHLVDVLGEPVATDNETIIFEVLDGPLPDQTLYASRGGWTIEGQPNSQWMSDSLVLYTYHPEDTSVVWAFDANSWLLDRWVTLEMPDGTRLSYFVPAGDTSDLHFWHEPVLVEQGFQQTTVTADPETSMGCTVMPDEDLCRALAIAQPHMIGALDLPDPMANFNDSFRLLDATVYIDDETIDVQSYWQALDAQREDVTLFVHLLDAEGSLAAQWDGPLGGATMPTSVWPLNGHAWQESHIEVPAGLPAGEYKLVLGLYTYPDLIRLPVQSDQTIAQDGLYLLQSVTLS